MRGFIDCASMAWLLATARGALLVILLDHVVVEQAVLLAPSLSRDRLRLYAPRLSSLAEHSMS